MNKMTAQDQITRKDKKHPALLLAEINKIDHVTKSGRFVSALSTNLYSQIFFFIPSITHLRSLSISAQTPPHPPPNFTSNFLFVAFIVQPCVTDVDAILLPRFSQNSCFIASFISISFSTHTGLFHLVVTIKCPPDTNHFFLVTD